MLLHDDTPGVVNLVLNLMSGLVQDLGEAAPGSGRGEAREHQDLWRGDEARHHQDPREETRRGDEIWIWY